MATESTEEHGKIKSRNSLVQYEIFLVMVAPGRKDKDINGHGRTREIKPIIILGAGCSGHSSAGIHSDAQKSDVPLGTRLSGIIRNRNNEGQGADQNSGERWLGTSQNARESSSIQAP